VFDIALADGTSLAQGIPLVTGVDLLSQVSYLNIGGQLFVQSPGNKSATPGVNDLGVNSFVFFVVP
jgi:hypothetical protein